MKFLILTLAFALASMLEVKAQSDTLVISLKNNQTDKIAVSQIQKIQFENINSVNEQNQPYAVLDVKGNYPNPFQSQTNIEFEIATPGNVEIIIYDNSGKQIQTLKCENCQPGKNTLLWNCLDKNKNRVRSGVYFYEVHYKNEVQAKKMLVIGGGK